MAGGSQIIINKNGITFITPGKLEAKAGQHLFKGVIYAELSGDFPLGDSRQPTYKSLRPFDLVS